MATLYISRGRERAHIHVHEKEEHVRAELAAAHTKKPAEQPSCNGKNRWRHRKIYPYLGCIFSKGGEKTEKNSFLTPQKIHGLPDLFPGNSHFYASRRTETSQELPILCHPKDINFPDMTIFMPIGRRKKINLTTFFFAPLGNPDRNSFPERQEIRKKFPEKLETELHIHNLNRDFSMQHNLNHLDNLKPQAHSFPRLPIVFMFFYRETYVFPVGNLRFTAGNVRLPYRKHGKHKGSGRLSYRHY